MSLKKPEPKTNVSDRVNKAADYADSKKKPIDEEEGTKRFNALIPKSLHRRFHRHAIDTDRSMSEILIELLEREIP